MKKTLSTLIVIFSISSLYAQNDTTVSEILPYFEPLHSDRPGATYDASVLRSGVQLQFGTYVGDGYAAPGYKNDAYNDYGTSATVRIPTCIGEFDASLNASQFTQDFISYGSSFVTDTRRIYTDIGASVLYRNEIYSTDKFMFGGLIGATYESRVESFNADRFPRFDSLTFRNNNYQLTSNNYGAIGFLNLQYSITDHWTVASSVGGTGDIYGGDSYQLMVTLNVGYSYRKWGFFGEYILSDEEGLRDPMYVQAGATYNVSRDFQLDAFVSSYDVNGQYAAVTAELKSINMGFTYLIR